MRFEYSGGTDRQRRWVQDAIAACSYPLSVLDATVTVTWGPLPPADVRHPYMVTEVKDSARFLITIDPGADDPGNPKNRGLPHPAEDVYDFYKQSFVHELGHVVTDSTFNPDGTDTDPRVAQCCALFWRQATNSGSGRRFGTAADWDDASLAWADEIREGVAEVFKCAFYKGRLIYQNRTNWSLDSVDWTTFLAFITVIGLQKTSMASTSLKVVQMDNSRPGGVSQPSVDIALTIAGYPLSPHLHLGATGDSGPWTAWVGQLGNLADIVAQSPPLPSPPLWLWLSCDLTTGQATGKVTSDPGGVVVLWSYTFALGVGLVDPPVPPPSDVFAGRLRFVDGDVYEPFLGGGMFGPLVGGTPAKIADWRFAAPGQTPPDGFNEQFGSPADIHLFDLLEEFLGPGTPSGNRATLVWDGNLYFVVTLGADPSEAVSPSVSLQSPMPSAGPLLTLPDFPFVEGGDIDASGGAARGEVIIGG